jgi:hypothetical protein
MTADRNQMNDTIRGHLSRLVKTAGLPDNEDSLQRLETAWLEKMESFDSQVEEKGMETVESFSADEEKGALLMTYSGSLITLGPAEEGKRAVEYRSIGLRNDVPQSADAESSSLTADVAVDTVAAFTSGPIEKSSPVFKIAVVADDLDEEEQEELLGDVTRILTESFVEVNKTIIT